MVNISFLTKFMDNVSYGGSYANAYAMVVEALSETPVSTEMTNVNDVVGLLLIYIIDIGAAIIIAVAIVSLLVLRKRP